MMIMIVVVVIMVIIGCHSAWRRASRCRACRSCTLEFREMNLLDVSLSFKQHKKWDTQVARILRSYGLVAEKIEYFDCMLHDTRLYHVTVLSPFYISVCGMLVFFQYCRFPLQKFSGCSVTCLFVKSFSIILSGI